MRATRRQMIAAAAAIGASTRLWAQPRRPSLVRRDVLSPQAQGDLVKYARAVRQMMSLPPGDPRSWTYQWYIHSVPSDRTKQQELQRLFGPGNPGLQLASETWSTCQSHDFGTNPDDFLPWHRMYLMCFETTVRSVLNDPTFVLPYWNYLHPAQRSLPPSFLDGLDSVFGALHRPNRNPGINGGAPIDGGIQQMINADALSSATYRPAGARQGFCGHIDSRLHGTIHVRVGNSQGMGNVPWAANDPIFWLHHANIDRLWASWNDNGGRNPQDAAWLQRRFVFPNGTGGRAQMRNGEVTSLEFARYSYDRLEPGPMIVTPTAGAAERPVIVRDTLPAPAVVPPGGATVPLQPVKRPPGIVPVAGTRLYLILSQLSAPDTPGVVYQVDLRDRNRRWVTVGHINFFDSVARAGAGHEGHGRQFSFDVTSIVAGTGRRPEVRIVPVGNPEGGISVTIGRVDLVEN